MNYFYILIYITVGYIINRSISKDGYKINKRLPYIKIKFIQISPNIKIHFKKRSIHIHHWMTYSIILILSLTLNTAVFDSLFSKGFLIGGILQGLSFPDWKRLIIKRVI